MTYDEAVKFINQVLGSVNVNRDQHATISRAFGIILNGPPTEEPKDGDDAIPVQRAVQPSQ